MITSFGQIIIIHPLQKNKKKTSIKLLGTGVVHHNLWLTKINKNRPHLPLWLVNLSPSKSLGIPPTPEIRPHHRGLWKPLVSLHKAGFLFHPYFVSGVTSWPHDSRHHLPPPWAHLSHCQNVLSILEAKEIGFLPLQSIQTPVPDRGKAIPDREKSSKGETRGPLFWMVKNQWLTVTGVKKNTPYRGDNFS